MRVSIFPVGRIFPLFCGAVTLRRGYVGTGYDPFNSLRRQYEIPSDNRWTRYATDELNSRFKPYDFGDSDCHEVKTRTVNLAKRTRALRGRTTANPVNGAKKVKTHLSASRK